MTTSALATDRSTPPADGSTIASSLQALNDRMTAMAEVIDTLRPLIALAAQAPALAAMVGDSFDDVMKQTIDSGVDVERGVLNGAAAALRFGAVMDEDTVGDLETLLQSGLLDPAVLRVIGELGRSLAETAAAPPPAVGPLRLVKALADPDLQRALGFLVTLAERFGRRLHEMQPAQS